MATFIEEVLKRNNQRLDVDPELASKISGEIRRLHAEALRKLENLRAFTDPATGKFLDTTAARFAAEATAAEMEQLARSSYLNLGDTLADLKAGEFKVGLEDVSEALEASRGVHTKLGGSMSQVFKEAGEAAAKKPVLGLGPKTSWDGLSETAQRDYRAAFTKAVINGESIPKTAEQLREIKDLNETQSLRIARTNMIAAQNDGQRAFYESSPDIYIGYRWEATLDNRTSAICAMLHGTFYPLGSTPPGPPAHPNCRCVLVGVLRDEALQEELDNTERRARILDKDGNAINPDTGRLYGTEILSAQQTNDFSKWLREQSPDVSNRMLGGKLKGGLFRSNKIFIEDIVRPDFKMRSNKEVVFRAMARNPNDDVLRAMGQKLGIDPRDATLEALQASDLNLIKDARYTLGVSQNMDPVYREQIERVQGRRTQARETARVARDTAQQEARKILAEKEEQLAEALPSTWQHLDLPATGLTNAEKKALKSSLDEIASGWKKPVEEAKAKLVTMKESPRSYVNPMRQTIRQNEEALARIQKAAELQETQRIAAKLEVEAHRAGKELRALGITEDVLKKAAESDEAARAAMKTIREGLKASAAMAVDEARIQAVLKKFDEGLARAKGREFEMGMYEAYTKQGREALEETLRMAESGLLSDSKFPDINWKFKSGRSHANPVDNFVALDSVPGQDAKEYTARVVPHEFGHHLEFRAADGKAFSASEIEVIRESIEAMKEGKTPLFGTIKNHKKSEVAMKDVYWNDYVAKKYNGATEVVSMGLQALFHPESFRLMAGSESGRRHLRYLFAFLRGRLDKII